MKNNCKVEKQRIWQFDMLKFFAIYSVILGHVLLHSGYDWHAAFGLPANVFIYSFHLPLFMTISGYFSNFSDFDKFKKRIISLSIPIVSFSFVNIILYSFFKFKVDLWFIVSLIVCNILVFGFIWFGKSFIIRVLLLCTILVLVVASAIFPFSSQYQIVWMLPFFVGGYILKRKIGIIKNNPVVFLCCSLFCYIFFMVFLYDYTYTYDISGMRLVSRSGIQWDIVKISIVRFLTSGSVVLAFISLALILPPPCNVKVFSLGKYTLEIYIISMCLDKYHFSLSVSNDNVYTINSIIIALFLMMVSYIIVSAIRKNRVLNKMMFGK